MLDNDLTEKPGKGWTPFVPILRRRAPTWSPHAGIASGHYLDTIEEGRCEGRARLHPFSVWISAQGVALLTMLGGPFRRAPQTRQRRPMPLTFVAQKCRDA